MKQNFTCIMLAGILAFTSCKKEQAQDSTTASTKIAPDGFNFVTSKNVNLKVTLQTNNNVAIPNVVVSVYLPTSTSDVIFKGVTDKSGVLTGTITVPASTTRLVIDPAYVGLLRNAQAVISNSNTITATIGGKDGFGGDIVAEDVSTNMSTLVSASGSNLQTDGVSATDYVYPTGYTATNAFVSNSTYSKSLGRPAYLETPSDVIDQSMLTFINSSLPESKPLTTTHPEYLTSAAVPDLNITALADVWITFVSEGAGNKNTLGFYTYKTGHPPTSNAGGTANGGIDSVTYIFPNASAYGSGGGLLAGDKVHLGVFQPGTSIGFVLLASSWSGSGVYTGSTVTKFYSNPNLNPESTAATRKHTVLLYDDVHQVYMIGFEDKNRQTGGSDNDFNDIVVYATSNPRTAISHDGVSVVDKGTADSDGDGVPDDTDEFPTDPKRAYTSYYPSQNTFANIGFEDHWPDKGDYDLNDLVVNYRYSFVSNAQNQVVDLKGEYSVAAAGAAYKNGFGVQLPVAASAVASVTGQKSISKYITMASNGVEAGQTKAVIIPFDNHEALIKNPDGSYLINTLASKDKVTSQTATVQLSFTSPVDQSVLQPASFNPFLISNLRRGYEVHLPGYVPTDKATTSLFATGDDASVPASNKYYVSRENWPWAIQFTGTYNYPYEGISINKSFLHFSDWAGSGGSSFTDWYSNTASGYRDILSIYNK